MLFMLYPKKGNKHYGYSSIASVIKTRRVTTKRNLFLRILLKNSLFFPMKIHKATTFEVIEVVERPLKDFDTWNRSAKLVVSQKALESNFLSERLSMSLHIIAEDRDYASLTESLIEDLDGKHFELKDFAGMYQRERDITKVARILFFGFATIIALISLANIYNSLISSLRFRKKEFAMLRSVGLDEASFRKMIRFESFF